MIGGVMSRSDKIEKKVILEFNALLKDETSRIERYKLYKKLLNYIPGILMGILIAVDLEIQINRTFLLILFGF